MQGSITNLSNKVNNLERRIEALESYLIISKNVNELLLKKIDNQEAYSRRPCIVVSGINQEYNERQEVLENRVTQSLSETGLTEDEIKNNVDIAFA